MGKSKDTTETIKFSKYHGATNDLIMINNTEGIFDKHRDNAELISLMCSRREGIGSDGLVELISHPDFVFEMVFYKASGERGRFGGNAARCSVAFAHTIGLTKATKFLFFASDGQHWADYRKSSGIVEIGLGTITGLLVYNYNQFFVDSGSPHHMVFVEPEALGDYDILTHGKNICDNGQYEDLGGTNVNFVASLSENEIKIRTFERGVQGEIPACGTGAVASALANSVRISRLQRTATSDAKPMQINTTVHCPADDLMVRYRHVPGTSEFVSVSLTGPIKHVFSGMFKVPMELGSKAVPITLEDETDDDSDDEED